MTETNILINSINDVKNFVNTVSRFSCDVDLVSGRYIVDGKSIMGIFSLDLSKPIEVIINGGEEEKELYEALKPFIIA